MDRHVVVIGGGNAGLCAAIEASERGRNVTLIEASPKEMRGGNSKYTRDLRYAHLDDQYTSGEYSKPELLDDLRKVSGDGFDEKVAGIVIDLSEKIPEWMSHHGVVFKREIRGTLNLNRTNVFFLGGGKALIDAYYKQIEKLGVRIMYDTQVVSVDISDNRIVGIGISGNGNGRTIAGDEFIFASGGFEANREWLSEFWGDAAGNIKVRGSRFNTGLPLKALLRAGAIPCGQERAGHMVAVDARSPDYDGGIVTRIDAIPWGIVVNSVGERFYDEGEDIWPKRYAIWGRLIAEQQNQIAYVITDSKTIGKYMPTAYPPIQARDLVEAAQLLGIDSRKLIETVNAFNSGIEKAGEDLFNWTNAQVSPRKSHWAIPIDTPPFLIYPVRPGLTFTYQGVAIDSTCKIRTSDGIIENGFAAGEIASGNILRSGYLAGFGLTIGTVLGRISGGWNGD
ncbi:MAG TPA: FAD-dependent tricarballylate dehydrogenase TcuA [Thermoplasmataceae archaeon]|nr:FAD-dependent tricarballylate dehydrogenase TcuA [Thermoplasmataceae archaeon]